MAIFAEKLWRHIHIYLFYNAIYLIEKLTVFIQGISLTMGRIVPGLAKAMERSTNFNIMEPFHDNCG
jgi:hypothetical protein